MLIKLKISFLAMLCLGIFGWAESSEAVISAVRPRIFLNAELIEKIKCRAGTNAQSCNGFGGEVFESHKASYDAMKIYIDANLASLDMYAQKKIGHIAALGVLHYCNGNPAYSSQAITYLMTWADSSHVDSEIALTLALGYDWFYDQLTEEQRTIIEHTLQVSSYVQSQLSHPVDVHGAWNGHYMKEEGNTYFPSYLALAGETLTDATVNGGTYNGQTVSAQTYGPDWIKQKADAEWSDNLLPAYEQVAGTWGGNQMGWGTYFGSVTWRLIMFLTAWRDAGVEDLLSANQFVSTTDNHFIFGLKPNRPGALFINDDNDNDWTANAMTYLALLFSAHVTNDQHTQWAIDEIDTTGVGEPVYSWVKPFYLMYYDPDRLTTIPAVADLGDTLYEDGTGVVINRTGWGSEDSLLMFKCGDYYDGHSHFDNNSFLIYYKGDLAGNSGYYSNDVTDIYLHYQNYYKRTVSRNSMLIYDPDEVFLQDNSTVRHNDGGQDFTWGSMVSGYTQNRPQRYGDVIPDSEWDRCDITDFESNSDYVYSLGDATRSYNSDKCSQAKRGVVRFKDSNDILVFDYVSTTDAKPNLEKRWVIHSMDYPEVTGGEVAQDSRNGYGGGVINYSGSPSLIKITDVPKTITRGATNINHLGGSGILYLSPIYPEYRQVSLIGGKDASGNSFTASSYEFYYNGQQHQNYVFGDKPEIGVWRTEIIPSGADVKKDSFFLNAIHLTDSAVDTLQTSRIEALSANMRGLQFQGSTYSKVALFSADSQMGEVSGEIHYALSNLTGEVHHYLFHMTPNAKYSVATASAGQDITVTPDAGGVYTATAEGTLDFVTNDSGADIVAPSAPSSLSVQ